MVEVGKDLWRSSSATTPVKQGRLADVAQDHIQVGFEYFQRRRLHNLFGQPVPALCHPYSKEVSSHIQPKLPVCQCVPIVLLLGTTEKSLVPSF